MDNKPIADLETTRIQIKKIMDTALGESDECLQCFIVVNTDEMKDTGIVLGIDLVNINPRIKNKVTALIKAIKETPKAHMKKL